MAIGTITNYASLNTPSKFTIQFRRDGTLLAEFNVHVRIVVPPYFEASDNGDRILIFRLGHLASHGAIRTIAPAGPCGGTA